MRCGCYTCKEKDTGFPIKNVGNDKKSPLTPALSLKGRGSCGAEIIKE